MREHPSGTTRLQPLLFPLLILGSLTAVWVARLGGSDGLLVAHPTMDV